MNFFVMLKRSVYFAPEDDGGGSGGGSSGTFSQEYVRELRAENKSLRLAKQQAVADLEKIQGENKTLQEAAAKAGTEADAKIAAAQADAKKSADERIVRSELKAAALKAGMVDVDGLKLADLSGVKLTADGNGVEGADALMTALKESKPYLFGGAPNSSSTEPKPKPADSTQVKQAQDLTKPEYASQLASLIKPQ